MNVVFTVTRYVLNEAGRGELLNLGQHPPADEYDSCSNNTMNSKM